MVASAISRVLALYCLSISGLWAPLTRTQMRELGMLKIAIISPDAEHSRQERSHFSRGCCRRKRLRRIDLPEIGYYSTSQINFYIVFLLGHATTIYPPLRTSSVAPKSLELFLKSFELLPRTITAGASSYLDLFCLLLSSLFASNLLTL